MIVTGVFFFIFSLPSVLWLKERSLKKQREKKASLFFIALKENIETFKKSGKNKNLFTFLLSFFFFSAGIIVVITFSSIFAKEEFGFKTKELLVLIIGVNIAASIGAFLFGFLQDKIGAKKTIIINLFIWCAVITGIFFAKSKPMFYVLGIFIGICLGSTQSSSRAVIGLLTKEGRFGEDFGLWGFFGKLASILGSFSYGFLVFILKSRRFAILFVLLFFIIGLITLFFVKIPHKNKILN
jgi:UMF1 family MFS transporter